MGDVIIRQAVMEDAGIIAALTLPVQDVHVAARPDIFHPMQVTEALMRETVGRLSAPDHYYFIAEVKGEAAGCVFALLRERSEDLYTNAMRFLAVDQISVSPEYRSQGCGEALMARVAALAKELGVARVVLDVWAFNARAIDFYERLGFRVFVQRMEMTVE